MYLFYFLTQNFHGLGMRFNRFFISLVSNISIQRPMIIPRENKMALLFFQAISMKVILKVQYQVQQHPHPLGTCEKGSCLIQSILIRGSGDGTQKSILTGPSADLMHTQVGDPLVSMHSFLIHTSRLFKVFVFLESMVSFLNWQPNRPLPVSIYREIQVAYYLNFGLPKFWYLLGDTKRTVLSKCSHKKNTLAMVVELVLI